MGKLAVIGAILTAALFVGCVSNPKRETSPAVKVAQLEAKLRTARIEIETLRERNWILKTRIKIVRANGGIDPQVAPSKLAAFTPGVRLDVPVRATNLGSRENVALVPKRLPAKRKLHPQTQAEQADRVLTRTILELLKVGDEAEAERTAVLLEKSYPQSELVAEARFQQGLYYFRKKNLRRADRLFLATLQKPNAHVRARAGAALMRGVIAERVAVEGENSGIDAAKVQLNRKLSRRSFDYVLKQFPGTPEAKRATRELRKMTRVK